MSRNLARYTKTIPALVLSTICAAALLADVNAAPAPYGAYKAAPPAYTDSSAVTRQIRVGSLTRRYVAYLPPNFREKEPLPVVLAFHGALGDPEQFSELTNLHNAREAAGFIVVYPEGYRRTWNVGGGCCGQAGQQNIDDIGYVRRMLDDLDSIARIDRNRIYAAGYSNGGAMSFHLACDMADTIVAIATVGSVMRQERSTCRPSRPVSVFEWHGLLDNVSPYNGGRTGAKGAADAPPVRETVDFWRDLNGARNAERVAMFGGNADCDIYKGGRDGTMVQHCRVPGLGHRWPGSRATQRSIAGDRFAARFVGDLGPYGPPIDANDAILSFFRQYSMPPRR